MVLPKLSLVVFGLLGTTGIYAQGSDAPFHYVERNQFHAEQLDNVLFSTDQYVLQKNPDAKASDFNDLYWVNLAGAAKTTVNPSDYGRVVFAKADELFSVVELDEEAAEELSQALHSAGSSCGVLFRLQGDTVTLAARAKTPTPIKPISGKLDIVANVINLVDQANIRTTVEDMSSIYTRHHSSETGHGVAARLVARYQEYANGREDVAISTYEHDSGTNQPSLLVRIEGATKPDEIIVLGSHIDSISYWGGRSPGADDNASGTATNLEIFRVIMEQGLHFDRTIEIHGYAAEEIGLVGSQDMARDYVNAGKNVVAMVQHDMNIYRSGREDKIWFVSNSTNGALNQDLENLTDSYVGVAWGTASLSGGSSDHASWNRLGVPAAFPFEDPSHYNGNIHSSSDTIENSGAFSQAAAFAKLGVAFLGHYAGVISSVN